MENQYNGIDDHPTGGVKRLITYVARHGFYLVECDRCGHQTTVTTARTEQRAIEIAARWGWTSSGGQSHFCPRCGRIVRTLAPGK